MSDTRPTNCRFRMHDEGKAYPRSRCPACGKTVLTGLGNRCDFVPAPAVPDDVAELIEDIRSDDDTGDIRSYLASRIIATIEAQAAELARLRTQIADMDKTLTTAMQLASMEMRETAAQPAPDAVAEAALVEAIGASIFGRHERGFVLWPLIEGDELKAGIRAALAKGSRT